MNDYIFAGMDVHDRSLVVKVAVNRDEAQEMSLPNSPTGRTTLLRHLKSLTRARPGAQVVVGYEASCQGYGLYDDCTAAGLDCRVLAPTRIPKSPHEKKRKNDHRDAEAVLALLRGHFLAGNKLPDIRVPSPQVRDDRELTRCRLDLSDKRTSVKAQIRTLLKRTGRARPSDVGDGWSEGYVAWLKALAAANGPLSPGARRVLGSLLRQFELLQKEIARLDRDVESLSKAARYREPAQALLGLEGVGVLVAMVFLTELGDLGRFRNRRQVGSYLGLAPSSNESGEATDRKGHITHAGPGRVRKVLCQAAWVRIAHDPCEAEVRKRIIAKNPKHGKIATVACMRRLAIRMWHVGLEAQRQALQAAPSAAA